MYKLRAEKGNKVYTIDETMKPQYLADGFDVTDDEGNVIAYGRGRTASYEDYMRAVKEIGRLQELAAAQCSEIETLKAEVAELHETNQGPAKQEPKKMESKKAGE